MIRIGLVNVTLVAWERPILVIAVAPLPLLLNS